MKISNLSRKSGVSVATIKFYLRERLLPSGTPTARNQAEYDDTHLARLRLIRVLTGIGMMSLASVREVLAAVDDNCVSPHALYQALNRAMSAEHPVPHPDAGRPASESVDKLIDCLGWQVQPDSPGRATLVQVLASLQYLDWECDAEVFAPYAQVADRLAASELKAMPNASAQMIVARTVLFEVAFAVLRRLAYEHYLVMRGKAAPPPAAGEAPG